jgi:hypothetical protein
MVKRAQLAGIPVIIPTKVSEPDWIADHLGNVAKIRDIFPGSEVIG